MILAGGCATSSASSCVYFVDLSVSSDTADVDSGVPSFEGESSSDGDDSRLARLFILHRQKLGPGPTEQLSCRYLDVLLC